MNDKVLILNEFEENENIEEVFYDLDGIVIEDILSIKKDDGTLPLDEIFNVSELIDTVKSESVLLCKKISKGQCETIAYMRNVTWHKNPYYYNWDFYAYNLECKVEDAFLIPKQDRIVFGTFTGHRFDDSPKIRKYIEQISKEENCIKVDVTAIDKRIKTAATYKELVDISAEYDSLHQYKKGLALWEKEYNKDKNNPDIIFQYAISNMDCNNTKLARKLMESIFEERKNDDYYLSRLAILYFVDNYHSNAKNILDMIKDKSYLEDWGYSYEHIMSYAPVHFESDNVLGNNFIKHKVNLGITEMPLPEIIQNGKAKRYFDPIRKKGINVTKEETIRQQVLRYLLDVIKVPEEMIVSEDHMAHYDKSATIRADITVRNRNDTLLIVECKEPNVPIDGEPIKQLFGYNEIMKSKYLLLTNGDDSYVFQRNEKNEYESIMKLPTFDIMNSGEKVDVIKFNKKAVKRPKISEMNDQKVIEQYRNDGMYLGVNTKDDIAPFALNLMWGFVDDEHKIEHKKAYGIEIMQDLGLTDMTLTNASGGKFPGRYRHFVVRDRNGDDCLLSFAVLGTYAESKTKGGYTSLVCGVDRSSQPIARLELRVDACCNIGRHSTYLFHNGIRSRKKCQTTIDYVSSICDALVKDNMIELGYFPNDKLIKTNDENVQDFIARLCAYTLLRDEMSRKGI